MPLSSLKKRLPEPVGAGLESVVHNIVDVLRGTSGVYDDAVMERYGIDNLEEALADSDICRCSLCGWWVDKSEAENSVCEECDS